MTRAPSTIDASSGSVTNPVISRLSIDAASERAHSSRSPVPTIVTRTSGSFARARPRRPPLLGPKSPEEQHAVARRVARGARVAVRRALTKFGMTTDSIPRRAWTRWTKRETATKEETRPVHPPVERHRRAELRKLVAQPRLVAIPPSAADVDRARPEHLEVVERLDDRNAAPRRDDDGGDRELGIELVGVHDVGPELVDEAIRRPCRLTFQSALRNTRPCASSPRWSRERVSPSSRRTARRSRGSPGDRVDKNRTSWPRSRSAAARPRAC